MLSQTTNPLTHFPSVFPIKILFCLKKSRKRVNIWSWINNLYFSHEVVGHNRVFRWYRSNDAVANCLLCLNWSVHYPDEAHAIHVTTYKKWESYLPRSLFVLFHKWHFTYIITKHSFCYVNFTFIQWKLNCIHFQLQCKTKYTLLVSTSKLL